MTTKENILNFIRNRFSDSEIIKILFLNKNCYYFSIILENRFKYLNPEIYYDVINGHFITLIDDIFYDISGVYHELTDEEKTKIDQINNSINNKENNTDYSLPIKKHNIILINWKYFREYDCYLYNRIIRDCIY